VSAVPPGRLPIALWLVPSRGWHARFASTIDALGRAHEGPPFEPHVTLHVGFCDAPDRLAEALADAAARLAPLKVEAGATAHSDAHFKTLYVELDDPRLHALRGALCHALGAGGDYALHPHLSLLYHGGLAPATRAALARAHAYSGERIGFDEVVVVRPPVGGDLSDIRRIDTTLRCRLGAAG
jgi:2'-5' RNA ligase